MTDNELILALAKSLEATTFIAEIVAHLQGLEREILPTTDAARELLKLVAQRTNI